MNKISEHYLTPSSNSDVSSAATGAPVARRWLNAARYRVTFVEGIGKKGVSVVAEWLPYSDADSLRNRLNADLFKQNGGARRFGDPYYGIELHAPRIVSGDKASPGDLVFHEVELEGCGVGLASAQVSRRFHLAGLVIGTDRLGRIKSLRDREGEHSKPPRAPMMVSAAEVDVAGVLDDIAMAEEERGRWAGEFTNTSAITPFLVRRMKMTSPATKRFAL